MAMFICPRCLYSAERAERISYCPRCGLAEMAASTYQGPRDIPFEKHLIKVGEPIGFGDVANLYHWTFAARKWAGVFKIARSHMANHYLKREARVLRELSKVDANYRFSPFLPQVIDSLSYGEPGRAALLLRYDPNISSPDELFSLEEVRQQYPHGVDARDMAWMWRRVLTILGFVHQQKVIHGCVTPDHILIEPKEHKAVLVGWASAAYFGDGPTLVPERWKGWSNWRGGASPATDLACAAKSMLYILKADSEPGIARHLERATESGASGSAWKMLEDFDLVIDALWGPRQFRPFAMIRPGPAAKEEPHG